MFKEVKNTYYNENEGFYSIDAWRTSNQDEEGIVVAKVYKDKVVYTRDNYENVPEIIEKVNEAKTFFK